MVRRWVLTAAVLLGAAASWSCWVEPGYRMPYPQPLPQRYYEVWVPPPQRLEADRWREAQRVARQCDEQRRKEAERFGRERREREQQALRESRERRERDRRQHMYWEQGHEGGGGSAPGGGEHGYPYGGHGRHSQQARPAGADEDQKAAGASSHGNEARPGQGRREQ